MTPNSPITFTPAEYKVISDALIQTCPCDYIHRHADILRQELDGDGNCVWGEPTFRAIQEDYDKMIIAINLIYAKGVASS